MGNDGALATALLTHRVFFLGYLMCVASPDPSPWSSRTGLLSPIGALLVSEEQTSPGDMEAASLQRVPQFSLCSQAPFKQGGPGPAVMAIRPTCTLKVRSLGASVKRAFPRISPMGMDSSRIALYHMQRACFSAHASPSSKQLCKIGMIPLSSAAYV